MRGDSVIPIALSPRFRGSSYAGLSMLALCSCYDAWQSLRSALETLVTLILLRIVLRRTPAASSVVSPGLLTLTPALRTLERCQSLKQSKQRCLSRTKLSSISPNSSHLVRQVLWDENAVSLRLLSRTRSNR